MIQKTIIASLLLLPNVALAAPKNLAEVIQLVNSYLGLVIPLLFSIAIIFFLVGIVKYFVSGGEKLEEAKQMALWGILALFVMVSVWGFVNILLNTFGFDNNLPGINPRSSSTNTNWQPGGNAQAPTFQQGGNAQNTQYGPTGGVNTNGRVPVQNAGVKQDYIDPTAGTI